MRLQFFVAVFSLINAAIALKEQKIIINTAKVHQKDKHKQTKQTIGYKVSLKSMRAMAD